MGGRSGEGGGGHFSKDSLEKKTAPLGLCDGRRVALQGTLCCVDERLHLMLRNNYTFKKYLIMN